MFIGTAERAGGRDVVEIDVVRVTICPTALETRPYERRGKSGMTNSRLTDDDNIICPRLDLEFIDGSGGSRITCWWG